MILQKRLKGKHNNNEVNSDGPVYPYPCISHGRCHRVHIRSKSAWLAAAERQTATKLGGVRFKGSERAEYQKSNMAFSSRNAFNLLQEEVGVVQSSPRSHSTQKGLMNHSGDRHARTQQMTNLIRTNMIIQAIVGDQGVEIWMQTASEGASLSKMRNKSSMCDMSCVFQARLSVLE